MLEIFAVVSGISTVVFIGILIVFFSITGRFKNLSVLFFTIDIIWFLIILITSEELSISSFRDVGYMFLTSIAFYIGCVKVKSV
ncbi:hypothetical protein SAMN02745245_01133 [Anaerosphaera aminiphila DSM 21120]|uniref:Uncharacterized protein n=1 Tax=Anaerosphaera aminiphila DSM 21120 TaxID=1120995 RepID=A0A1M5SBT0_9FIRM|nr:hypothetical protein [Anaerosphaera aminiphila]SHH35738.1 hypothetical protein SAMN02745245_01133 [Anaerosphaera aminiphila DSM 21120]